MTTTEALLFLGLMVFMIVTQVGRKPLSLVRLLRPLLISLGVTAFTVHGVDFSGGAGLLISLGVALGAVFGVLAASQMRIEWQGDTPYSTAGWTYALVWVVSMGGRVLFGLLVSHPGAVQDAVVRFSMHHHILGATAWTTAFILMTVTEIGLRTLLVLARSRRRVPHPAIA
ncbi:hypothetical protein [Deinococcus sonorensis]|uniref:Integral membrane protein n=2 Tax=Deinococcus sonorensis TaxID=309891 RepID=A0AAU7U696_9DEIO